MRNSLLMLLVAGLLLTPSPGSAQLRARAIGEAGRAEVMARFGTDAMVKRTVAVYNEVIEQAGMTPAAVEQSRQSRQSRENGTG